MDNLTGCLGEILAPQPGIEPAHLELEGKPLDHRGSPYRSTFYMLATVLGSEGPALGR